MESRYTSIQSDRFYIQDNVLVTHVGVALVTDFGVSRMLVVTHTIRDVLELMEIAIELAKSRVTRRMTHQSR